LKYHDALNYHQWEICDAACTLGEQLGVPTFRFLKDALTSVYGAEWYAELEEIYAEWLKQREPAGKKASGRE
jgi:hypothetical protein